MKDNIITVAVVDDERHGRENLRLLLEQDDEVELVGLCANGLEAIECVQARRPDVLFLDVQMPGMTGLDVVRALDELPVTIFVTAFSEYTLNAFDVSAVDYLLKPYDDDRFALALERAKTHVRQRDVKRYSERLISLLENRPSASQARGTLHARRLVVKETGKIYFIEVDDINWIEAAGSYVQVHTDERCHLLRDSMGNMEKQLDPNRFLRIHRSSIVNVDFVQELRPHLRGEYIVTLKDGTERKLSRRNRDKLDRILQA